jgi:hypothetical protein
MGAISRRCLRVCSVRNGTVRNSLIPTRRISGAPHKIDLMSARVLQGTCFSIYCAVALLNGLYRAAVTTIGHASTVVLPFNRRRSRRVKLYVNWALVSGGAGSMRCLSI